MWLLWVLKKNIMPKDKCYYKAKRKFKVYPSAYANMAASKYCKDPNYAKGSKKKKKSGKRRKFAGGGVATAGFGAVRQYR